MVEVWKDVKDFEGFYQVSNLGKIRSLDRYVNHRFGKQLVKGKILVLCPNSDGYYNHTFCKPGKRKSLKIHRVIAQAFIPNPQNLPEINHRNAIKTDNSLDNLEWCTKKYNQQHAHKNGLIDYSKGEHRYNHKLTEKDVLEIRREYIPFVTPQRELARKYGVSQKAILNVLKRRRWKHIE